MRRSGRRSRTIAGSQAAPGDEARPAVHFVALTAARSGEVRGMEWSEVDLAARTWTVPGSRMKAGRSHRVPLSGAALAVLAAARDLSGGEGLVFPSPRGKPLSDATLGKLLKDRGVPMRSRMVFAVASGTGAGSPGSLGRWPKPVSLTWSGTRRRPLMRGRTSSTSGPKSWRRGGGTSTSKSVRIRLRLLDRPRRIIAYEIRIRNDNTTPRETAGENDAQAGSRSSRVFVVWPSFS